MSEPTYRARTVEHATPHLPDAVPITFHEPVFDGDRPLGVIVALHGGLAFPFGELVAGIAVDLVAAGTLRPCLIVAPTSERSFWMDYRDGSARWESFVAEELVLRIREEPGVDADTPVALLGISMGGMGALRMAFKHPERFAAVAASEPAIDPVLTWSEIHPRSLAYRPIETMEKIFGSPIDEDYWNANNVPALARTHAQALRDSGLPIYFECGDEDGLLLHEGAEFLHQVLLADGVPHEYHLVRGANHVGMSVLGRVREALEFIGRALDPPPPDGRVDSLTSLLEKGRAQNDWPAYLARNRRAR